MELRGRIIYSSSEENGYNNKVTVPQLSLLRSFPLLQESSEVCHQQEVRRSERAFRLRAAPMGWPVALPPSRDPGGQPGQTAGCVVSDVVPLKGQGTSFLSDDLRCSAD